MSGRHIARKMPLHRQNFLSRRLIQRNRDGKLLVIPWIIGYQLFRRIYMQFFKEGGGFFTDALQGSYIHNTLLIPPK